VELGRGAVEDVDVTAAMEFWRGRRVLLTGHTGFKGSWMALRLESLGAEVCGLALAPEGPENLYGRLAPWSALRSALSDIRDEAATKRIVAEAAPEVVIHMAAQALVRRSYRDPAGTFATNVTGTVNVLAAAEACGSLRAALVVTSDKVYLNRENGRPFREDDPLGGDDPYSASKAAAEMAARAFRPRLPALGVARGGNVIGGGDWAEDRLIPDALRAAAAGHPVELRYPSSTRPWQHVLDVTDGYLAYAALLATQPADAPPALNFGPPPGAEPLSVSALVEQLQASFGWARGWRAAAGPHPPEKTALALDSSLAAETLGWRPKLDAASALDWVASWHRADMAGTDMRAFSLEQIEAHARRPAARTARSAA
jgi:CDP-glucose 4,6-dehydratase